MRDNEELAVIDEASDLSELTKEDLISKMQKKDWGDRLKCTSAYLDLYMKQVVDAEKSHNDKLNLGAAFPLPMFEWITTPGWYSRDRELMIKKGIPMNFHVLYAEAEILKVLIDS
jgi:nucleosome binding factor SPN SPT16 subunit